MDVTISLMLKNFLFLFSHIIVFHIIEISRYLRLDKGTETGEMATIHAYVRQSHEGGNDSEAVESVQYGPSTSNKVRKVPLM